MTFLDTKYTKDLCVIVYLITIFQAVSITESQNATYTTYPISLEEWLIFSILLAIASIIAYIEGKKFGDIDIGSNFCKTGKGP